MVSKLILALFLASIACTLALGQLDYLLAQDQEVFPFEDNVQYAAKRAPRGCICSGFLGCHGPGCMRKMRQ